MSFKQARNIISSPVMVSRKLEFVPCCSMHHKHDSSFSQAEVPSFIDHEQKKFKDAIHKMYAPQISTLLLLHVGSHSKVVHSQREGEEESASFFVYKYKEMGLSLVSGMLVGSILYYTRQKRKQRE